MNLRKFSVTLRELKETQRKAEERLQRKQPYQPTSLERHPPRLPDLLSYSARFQAEWRSVLAKASKNLTEIFLDKVDDKIVDQTDLYATGKTEAEQKIRAEVDVTEREAALKLFRILTDSDNKPRNVSKKRFSKK